MRTPSTIAVAIAIATALSACGDTSTSRAAVVDSLTADAVPERYEELAEQAEALTESVRRWCTTGEATAVSEQSDVVRARWLALAPFWFGPAMDRRSRVIIEPRAFPDDIQELLANDERIDAETLRDLYGADQRGLGALDVLLDANSGVPAARRCAYADAITELIAAETRLLADDWTRLGPELADNDGRANETLELIVNESLFAIDAMAREPAPNDDVRLEGVRWAIIGDDTDAHNGIADLLDDGVVARLSSEFDTATSLEEDALMELGRTITTNVVSALGISVQFSDADGDG